MLEEIAITKIADILFQKYNKLQEEKQNKVTIIKLDTNKFTYTELDDGSTQNKEYDKDNPDLQFKNPYKRKCLIKCVSITPDVLFKTNGMLEIYIGDEIFFKSKKFGNFKKIDSDVIPLDGGELIKPNESVKIYLKSSDGAAVGVAAQITFGV